MLEDEIQIAVLLASFKSHGRYLGDERDSHEVGGGHDVGDGDERVDATSSKSMHPQKLSRRAGQWDGRHDDIRHPDYNTILSELLPGERFILCGRVATKLRTDAYRKLCNSHLQFARFWEYSLSTTKDAKGIPQRTNHFRQRLFEKLPWWSCDDNTNVIVTPRTGSIAWSSQFFDIKTLGTLGQEVTKQMPASCLDLMCVEFLPAVAKQLDAKSGGDAKGDVKHEMPELICRELGKKLQ